MPNTSLSTITAKTVTPTARVIVFYQGERMGQARPLDAIANDRPPRRGASEGESERETPPPANPPPPPSMHHSRSLSPSLSHP